jgi:hypothetical protein
VRRMQNSRTRARGRAPGDDFKGDLAQGTILNYERPPPRGV